MELNNVAANQLRNALAQRLGPGPTRLLAAAPSPSAEGLLNGGSAGGRKGKMKTLAIRDVWEAGRGKREKGKDTACCA